MMNDLRYALRSLGRSPVLSATVIVTLALGTGANAAIFSVFNQVLIQRLPADAPERLVNLSSPGIRNGRVSSSDAGGSDAVFSYPMFRDLERDGASIFAGIAAHREFRANVASRGDARSETAELVSGSYFPLLGLRPALGRLFGPGDDRTPGGHFVTVLSHAYWRTRFNQDPAVVGTTLTVNGHPLTVVGVTPPDFTGTDVGSRPPLFVPLTMAELMLPHSLGLLNRNDYWLYLFARLPANVPGSAAAARINVAYAAILNDVELPLQSPMSAARREQFRTKPLLLEEGSQGQRPGRERLARVLWLLLAVSGLVLVIACANIANLLLARAATRASDTTVRLAVGASRWQVARHMLLECAVLAVAGTAGGLAVAALTLRAISSVMAAEGPSVFEFTMDTTVLLFSAALAVITTLLVGVYPAWSHARGNLSQALRGAGKTSSATRAAARFRASLVTVQIALSIALLAVAGLFTRSLINISRVDPGVQPTNLLAFGLSPELNGYAPAESRALFERVAAALRALPGVTHVSESAERLLTGDRSGANVSVEGFTPPPDADTDADYARVGPDYFRTLGIPLLAGREFSDGDTLDRPKVAIVNELFVRKFSLGAGAVGRRMALGAVGPQQLDIEIVGVVRNARHSNIKDAALPQFFLPYRQDEKAGALHFYVRSTTTSDGLMAAIPGLVSRIDPTLPVERLRPMSEQLWETAALDRVSARLASWFSVLAAILATLGLYGVLSYTITQRTREIGLRLALGAAAGDVRKMVLATVARMLLAGAVIGAIAALALGRVAQTLLFGVPGGDPLIIALAILGMAAVAAAAGAVPAYKASRIDPMQALRYG